jgi:DNA-binding transcriptional MocR family regulator
VALTALSDYYHDRNGDSSMLLLGYSRGSEESIRAGVRELAAAVRAARGRSVPRASAGSERSSGALQ